MYRYYILLLFFVYSSQDITRQSSEQCPQGNAFYEASNCQPIYYGNETCPKAYDCSKSRKSSPDECFFYGKIYKRGSIIPDIEEHCRFDCRCEENIDCAAVDCPEYFDDPKDGCFYKSEFSCCSDELICKSESTLVTCKYGNHNVTEGVLFYPHPCVKCICDEGWNEKNEKPFCKRVNCPVDEEYYDIFKSNCAPVYDRDDCCPRDIVCASKCPSYNNFYEGMNCKATYDVPKDTCPSGYDCSNVKKSCSDQCFFAGKFFAPGSDIVEEAEEHCMFGCQCMQKSKITCGMFDCPPVDYYPWKSGCFQSFGHSCCPNKVICESDGNLTSCTYNDETYLEGQTFYPDPCTDCVCGSGFRGKLEEPFCKRVKCLSDERYYEAVIHKCAPIYISDKCCPVAFGCADGNEIITSSSTIPAYTGSTCEFGDNILYGGDEVQINIPVKAICKCITPPLLTCISDIDYSVLFDLDIFPNYY